MEEMLFPDADPKPDSDFAKRAWNADLVPIDLLRRSKSLIEIQWSDGCRFLYPAHRLRSICPCATCRERRRGESDQEVEVVLNPKDDNQGAPPKPLVLPVLSAAEAKPDTIETLKPVGNYAYNIVFGDGHRTGIFTLEFLYQIGETGN